MLLTSSVWAPQRALRHVKADVLIQIRVLMENNLREGGSLLLRYHRILFELLLLFWRSRLRQLDGACMQAEIESALRRHLNVLVAFAAILTFVVLEGGAPCLGRRYPTSIQTPLSLFNLGEEGFACGHAGFVHAC